MKTQALGTLPRADKGPVAPPPALKGVLARVATDVAAWPGVTATTHWHLIERSRADGIDFYVGDEELGHIHLDGWIHLATSPTLGRTLIEEGLARPFPYQRGWVCEDVHALGHEASGSLFRRAYDDLVGATADID